MPDLTIPFNFTNGTTADAEQVDSNFAAVKAVVDDLDDANIAAGANIQGSKLADGSTPGGKLTDSTVPGSKLTDSSVTVGKLEPNARPSNLLAPYHSVSEVRGWYNDIINAADVYILLDGDRVRGNGDEAFTFDEAPPALVHLDPSRYVVAGLTPKLRIFATMTTNNTSPAINFTFSLRHVLLSGGDNPDVHSITLNSSEHVAGSDFVIAPGANSAGSFGASSDFDVPAAATYGFNLTTSTGVVSGSAGSIWVGLFVRWT